MTGRSTSSRIARGRDGFEGRPAPLGRMLAGPLDDHALLPWRFHPAMRAADGKLRRV